MKRTFLSVLAVCLLASGLSINSYGQSVPFPPEPNYNDLAPWGYTQVGTNFNTSPYLPFKYQGIWFRLMPPNGVTYNSGTNSWNYPAGTKYPMIVFSTGAGERGSDNNAQLKHGGQAHMQAVQSGRFPGFLLFWQTPNGYLESNKIQSIITKLLQTLPIDIDRIYAEGFSRGGTITWEYLRDLPRTFAAVFPMSAAAGSFFSAGSVHVPARLAQGGLDTNPTPLEAEDLVEEYADAGGNLEFFFFPNLGHGTWNTCYALPDFYEWFLQQRKNQIHVFFGETEVCPGDPVNIRLGLTAGFDQYQWMRNDAVISTATQNNYTATSFGDYQARFRRGTTWTEWSETVTIQERQPTQSPAIVTTGIKSAVLPSVDGSTSVQLEMPTGYQSYAWKNASNGTVIGNQRTIVISNPGSYVANVTEFGGCSSLDSPPFAVVNANGPNAPDAISNLQVGPLGLTSLKLDWENNPAPANDETGFEIYRSVSETGPFQLVKINPANLLTYTDPNLLSGARYYYVIRAVNNTAASVTSDPVSAVTGLDEVAPTPPASLTVTTSTPTSVTLRWNASTDNVGVVAYDIYANGTKVYTSTTLTSQITFIVNGLLSSQIYNFVVKARDAAGNSSEPSQQVTRATTFTGLNYTYYHGDWNELPNFDELVPVKVGWVSNFSLSPREQDDNFAFKFVGKLRVTNGGTYTFYLNSDDGSKLYINGVLRVNNDGLHGTGQVAGESFSLATGVHDIVVEQFDKTGGQALTVRWRRNSANIQTIPSSALTDVLTIPPAPATPVNLAVTPQSYEALLVSWNAYTGTGTSIEIQRSTNNFTWFPLATVPATQNNYTSTGLAANTRYYYRIRAIGTSGESSFTGSSNAFTLQLPPIPAAPSALSGTATASAASLQWNDNSNNEVSFEVYKSIGDNTNYQLAATIPGGEVPQVLYEDNGLFAHTTYFYQVRSKNVSGASSFSNEFQVTTTNSSPEITPASNFSMRFDEVKVIKIEANDSDGDAIIISGSNLPAFAELYDYGDGEGEIFFEPSEANLGDYPNIQITASDAFGGSSGTTFNLSVNNNHSPTIQPFENVSMDETFVVHKTIDGVDGDGDALTWELSNVPDFITYENSGNAVNLVIAPEESDAGIYTLGLKVADPQGSFSTEELVVQVTQFNPDFMVSVNFGNAATVPFPWNNFTNDNQGAALSNLTDNSGQETGIGITLDTDWSSTAATGGKFPGIYPDAVMNSYISTASTADPEIFRITGLNPNNKYNLDFFASRNSNGDRTTVFTINGVSSQVDATQNTSNLAEINNVSPSASGEITVEVTAAVEFGYLNAMVIESFFDGNTPPAAPTSFALGYTGEESDSRDLKLTWSDNSDNESGFEIFKGTDGLNFTKLTTTLPDEEIFIDTVYTAFVTYYYTVRAINGNGNSAFTDTLSIEALNQAPQLDAVPSITVTENSTKTVLISAVDPEGGAVMFFLQGAPDFVYLEFVDPNTMSLVASPLDDTNGEYNFAVGAMDEYGEISTVPVTVTVTDFPETLVYVNLTQTGVNAAAPWNNRAWPSNSAPAGQGLTNMLDNHSVATSIDFTLVENWGGANLSGTSAGIYEANVTRSALFYTAGSTRTIRFTGLKTDFIYDLSLFASRMEGGAQINRNVTYSAGTKSATINISNNTSDVAKLLALVPDASGELILTVARAAGNTSSIYLGSIIIREYKSNGLPTAPTNLITNVLSRNKIQLQWSDQSDSETGFEIWRSVGNNANFQLLTTTGPNVQSYDNNGLTQNTTYYYKVRAKVNDTTFSPYSPESSATTFQYAVSINFGAVNVAAGWNNLTAFLGSPGDAVNNLIDDSGVNSGMRLLIIDPFTDDNLNGMNTGNNSGIVPDAVMEGSYWVDPGGVTATFRIENLNLALAYNFGFFGSRNGGGDRNTVYTINGQSATLNAAFNTQNIVQLKNILPDGNGGVTVSVKAGPNSSFGYLNGLIIQASTPHGGDGAGRRKTASTDNATMGNPETSLDESVKAYPNPFEDHIVIHSEYSAKIADVTLFTATGIANQIPFTVNEVGDDHYISLSDANLTSGFYMVKVRFLDGANKTIKLVKK